MLKWAKSLLTKSEPVPIEQSNFLIMVRSQSNTFSREDGDFNELLDSLPDFDFYKKLTQGHEGQAAFLALHQTLCVYELFAQRNNGMDWETRQQLKQNCDMFDYQWVDDETANWVKQRIHTAITTLSPAEQAHHDFVYKNREPDLSQPTSSVMNIPNKTKSNRVNGSDFFIPSVPPSAEALMVLYEAWLVTFENGEAYSSFKKRFDAVMAEHGWTFEGRASDMARMVYQINTRIARMVRLWQQIQENKDIAPYLQYVGAVNSRHTHSQILNGLVFHVDDPIWFTHFPPNSIDCIDSITQRSEATMRRMGLALSHDSREILTTIKEPWNYNVAMGNMFVDTQFVVIDDYVRGYD